MPASDAVGEDGLMHARVEDSRRYGSVHGTVHAVAEGGKKTRCGHGKRWYNELRPTSDPIDCSRCLRYVDPDREEARTAAEIAVDRFFKDLP